MPYRDGEGSGWGMFIIGMMILELVLALERTYVPLCMAVLYLYGFEKSKVENLIKFFVLRTVLGVVEWMLVRMFEPAS